MRLVLFLLILFCLTLATGAVIALAVLAFHVDSTPWTQVTSWKSPLVLVGAALVLVSGLITVMLSAFWSFLTKRQETRQKEKPRPPRPQSNRRTTI